MFETYDVEVKGTDCANISKFEEKFTFKAAASFLNELLIQDVQEDINDSENLIFYKYQKVVQHKVWGNIFSWSFQWANKDGTNDIVE